MNQAWVVVTLVKILEYGREDLGFFVGEGDPPALRIEEVITTGGLEKGSLAEDVLMSCKEPTLAADGQSDNWGGSGGRHVNVLVGERSLQFRQLGVISGGVLLQSRSLVDAALVMGPERALKHGGGRVMDGNN